MLFSNNRADTGGKTNRCLVYGARAPWYWPDYKTVQVCRLCASATNPCDRTESWNILRVSFASVSCARGAPRCIAIYYVTGEYPGDDGARAYGSNDDGDDVWLGRRRQPVVFWRRTVRGAGHVLLWAAHGGQMFGHATAAAATTGDSCKQRSQSARNSNGAYRVMHGYIACVGIGT